MCPAQPRRCCWSHRRRYCRGRQSRHGCSRLPLSMIPTRTPVPSAGPPTLVPDGPGPPGAARWSSWPSRSSAPVEPTPPRAARPPPPAGPPGSPGGSRWPACETGPRSRPPNRSNAGRSAACAASIIAARFCPAWRPAALPRRSRSRAATGADGLVLQLHINHRRFSRLTGGRLNRTGHCQNPERRQEPDRTADQFHGVGRVCGRSRFIGWPVRKFGPLGQWRRPAGGARRCPGCGSSRRAAT